MNRSPRIAIVGAGWAGLAAAVELADRGCHVEVFEASRTLGGRARSLQWNDLTIDNGQHILIGAYTETLRLMRKVGVDPDKALLRMPLTLDYPGEFRLRAPHLPAPFHTACALAFARGLDWREKWAAIRLMTSLRRANWRIEPDVTVTEWLDSHKTPSRQRRLLWEPLCISALNTPAERASAQVLANVLRDSLGANRAASDMLIPQLPLSECFPEPAARYIMARGGKVHLGKRIASLRREAERWEIDDINHFDQVIVATAPYHVEHLWPAFVSAIEPLSYEPIVTCYLQYTPDVRLPAPMIGIADRLAQWLFDRGHCCAQHGLIAAVISARGRHLDIPVESLELQVHAEVARLIPELPPPLNTLTITERRATFSCVPALARPTEIVALDQPALAGDYTAGDYPGTIEWAVRSGISCASALRRALFPNR